MRSTLRTARAVLLLLLLAGSALCGARPVSGAPLTLAPAAGPTPPPANPFDPAAVGFPTELAGYKVVAVEPSPIPCV